MNRPVCVAIILFLIAACGLAVACFASHEPVEGNPDAIVYMEAAENLLKGRGLVAVERLYEASPLHRFADQRLTHYPPLFPLMVAGIGACGVAPMDAAKWLNILIGYGVYRATAGSAYLSIIAAAFFAASPATLAVHTEALSEPAFVFLGVSGLVLISSYLEKNRRILLLSAAGLVALAWMTRYVGAALMAAGALALLIRAKPSLWRRITDAAIFSIVASLPMIVWLMWNRAATGTAMHRPICYHPIDAQRLEGGFETVLRWFLPTEAPHMARFMVMGVVAIALVAIIAGILRNGCRFRTWSFLHMPPLCRVICLFGLAYLLVMVASIVFVDALVQFDSRNLFPLYICLVVATCSMGPSFRLSFGRVQFVLGCCALFAVLAVNTLAVGTWAATSHYERSTSTTSWADMGTIRWLQSLPPDIPIYTNAGMAVHFWTGRRTFGLPVKFDPMSNRPNMDYQKQMSALRDGLRQPGSALVLFRNPWPVYYPGEMELRREIDLVVVFEEPQGKVLRAAYP
jgi:hypothetical protein